MNKTFFLVLLFALSALAKIDEITFSGPRTPASSTIKVSFVGDILIHDALYQKVLDSKSQDFSQICKIQKNHFQRNAI